MKYCCAALAILLVVLGCEAQNRPFYAARPYRYPTLLSRFGDTEGSLNNRVGEGEAAVTPKPVTFVGGSVVDQELIDRVATWPVDKQPFWYVNSQAIQNNIRNPPQVNFNQPAAQSSFLSG